MSGSPKFGVFHWGDTGLDIAEGIYLFDSEDEAEEWMEETIRKFHAADTIGEYCDTRYDVLAWCQDGLGIGSFFHCYPIQERKP